MRRRRVGVSTTPAVQPSQPNPAGRIVAPVRQLCRQLMPAVLGMIAAACDARQPLAPVTPPRPEQARPALVDPVGEFSASGFLTSPGVTTGGTGGSMDWTNLGIAFNKDMWIRVRTSGTVTYTINPAARVTPCGFGCTDPRPLYGEGAAGGAGIGNTHKLRVSMSVGVLPGIGYSERLPRAYGENQLEWVVPVKAGWDLRANRFGLPGGPHCTNNCDPPYPQVGWYLLSGGTTFQVEEVIPLQVAPRKLEVARGDSVTFDAVAIEGTTRLRWYFGDSRSAGRVWACEGQTTCTVAVPKNGLMSVYGDYAGVTSFHARAEEVRVVDPQLTLRCTPNPVVRGSTIDCRVTSTAGEMTDVSWSFTDARGHVIRDSMRTSWAGRMLISGRLTVQARLNGAVAADDTTITVGPRRWPRPSVVAHEEPATHLPSPANVTRLGHLADSHVDDAPSPPVTGVRIDEGPNAGWWYVPNPIQDIRVTVHINEAAFQAGSAWYNLQTGGTWTDPNTGIKHPNGYCRRWQVPELRRLTREHEGSVASPVMSHVRAMQVYIANNAPQDSMANLIAWDDDLKEFTFAEMIGSHYRSYMAGNLTGYSAPHTTDSIPGVVPPAIFPCAPRPWY